MIALSFNQEKIPRTMTRAEWREVHRWRRVTQHKLKEMAEREIEAFRRMSEDLGTYGVARMRIAMDNIVNPPVLFYP